MSVKSGTRVTYSIRPEAVSVGVKRTRSAVNSLSGSYVETVYIGETVQHHFELSNGTRLQSLELEPSELPPGNTVQLTISPDEVVVLRD
jgi:ABC-type Fe3+/spermidine/putrescine transport system ATPase subunit